MSDSLIQIVASKRSVLGKKVSQRRQAGFVPGNIIIKGRPSVAIEIPQIQLVKVLEQVGYTQALELVVEKDKTTVLVTGVSFAPTQHKIPQHVVFSEVKKGERVHASIPLILVGEAPGVQKGLLVLQILHHIEVISPALKIPEQIEIDISGLIEDGDAVRLADVQLADEIELEVDPQTPIVKLEMSRSQTSQESEEEMEAAAAESEDEQSEGAESQDEESESRDNQAS